MKKDKQKTYVPSVMPFSSKRILAAMRRKVRQGCNRLSKADSRLSPKVRKILYLVILTIALIGNGVLIFQSLTS